MGWYTTNHHQCSTCGENPTLCVFVFALLQEKRDIFCDFCRHLNMDLRETIRSLIYQRLAVVAEEIFSVSERVLSEYEKEDSFLKKSIEDQRRILELVLNADTG